jgi:DNA-directed RNA polymerase subunit E'/Rpb7
MEEQPFAPSLLTMKVYLSFVEIGKNIQYNLQKKIEHQVDGKCIAEGLIVPHSVEVISYSAGKISMEDVEFQVVYQCRVCLPVEGMVIHCIAKSITKAGIHAEYVFEKRPLIAVFITRDENYENPEFVKIKADTNIQARVTGVIYELNDTIVTVTAEL